MNLTIDDYEKMLSEARKKGDLRREAGALMSLGGGHKRKGNAWEAIKYYENAFKTCQLLDDWMGMAHACRHLEDTYKWLLNDMERAI